MTPIPTPYDITEIPNLPWIPPVGVWLAVIGVILLFLVGVLLHARKGKQTVRNSSFLDALLTSIDELSTSKTPSRDHAVHLAQQALLATINLSAAPLTPSEIRNVTHAEQGIDASQVLTALADVKEDAFSPSDSSNHKRIEEDTRIRTLLTHTRAFITASLEHTSGRSSP